MSAIAEVLLEKGYKVTGSDLHRSNIIINLQKHGAIIFQGHSAENIKEAEAIVISSAIKEDNPELMAAKENNVPIYHRSDILAELLNLAKGIAVAGSHGKTTTSSMLSVVMDHAGVDPTVLIGGVVDYFHGNAKLGKSDYVIAEADESDGSFLKFNAYVAIVTNIEDDHMDHYKTMDNIIKAFQKFVADVQSGGTAILCLDHPNVQKIASLTTKPFISYGITSNADYKADNIRTDKGKTSFDVLYHEEDLGRIELNIPGRHNILNALATIAACRFLHVDMQRIKEGFKLFHGANRRFQTKAKNDDYWLVDDYAHHPTEIRTTLIAAKQTKPKRLICIFQPHRYSRTKLLAEEFGTCFTEADIVICTDIFAAGEKPIAGISGKIIVDEMAKNGQKATYIEDMQRICPYIQKIMLPGDLIITMGAGDIFKCGEELAKAIN